MGQIEQLKLGWWEVLREAAIAPDDADVRHLLAVLEESLLELDTVGQLQVAAEAIAQIVQVFQERLVLTFEEMEATASEGGPTMPQNAFDCIMYDKRWNWILNSLSSHWKVCLKSCQHARRNPLRVVLLLVN